MKLSNKSGRRRPLCSVGQRLVSRTVTTLPEDLVKRLMALGDGNLSAGIRRMAELAK
jgi:hypothetical protein